jgi:hypothetical protein
MPQVVPAEGLDLGHLDGDCDCDACDEAYYPRGFRSSRRFVLDTDAMMAARARGTKIEPTSSSTGRIQLFDCRLVQF